MLSRVVRKDLTVKVTVQQKLKGRATLEISLGGKGLSAT